MISEQVQLLTCQTPVYILSKKGCLAREFPLILTLSTHTICIILSSFVVCTTHTLDIRSLLVSTNTIMWKSYNNRLSIQVLLLYTMACVENITPKKTRQLTVVIIIKSPWQRRWRTQFIWHVLSSATSHMTVMWSTQAYKYTESQISLKRPELTSWRYTEWRRLSIHPYTQYRVLVSPATNHDHCITR